MKIEIDDERNLHIDMRDQVSEIIQDFSEIISGSVSTPANRFLMDVNESEPTLNKSRSEEFHSTVAKLLYLEKRGRPDLEPTIAFLTTRVSKPLESDWRKLIRALTYLNQTKNDVRVIGCDNIGKIFTWIDAAYAVHDNMRSHTGGIISFGRGSLHAKSSKQKLNTKSSTEAEVVGLSEYLPYNLWLVNFLGAQGYTIESNIVYQDNQSAIRMEKNGRNSCTGNSRHIHIRYFFVKDRIDKNEVTIEYCPTLQMLADYFTKPLQGSLFNKLRKVIMGWAHIDTLQSSNVDVSVPKERVEISNEIDKVSTNTSSVRNTLSNKIGTKEKERKMVFLKSPHTYAEIVKGQQYNGEINTCSMEPMTKIENMKSNNR